MNICSEARFTIALMGAIAAAAPAQSKTTDVVKVLLDLDTRLSYGNREATGDFEDSDRSNVVAGGRLGIDYRSGANEYSLDLQSQIVEYFDRDQRDLWSNGVTLGYGRRLNPDLKIVFDARYLTETIGLEYLKFDESRLRSRLIYNAGDNRLIVGGGFRWRDYDDSTESEGKGYFLGVEGRRKLGRYQFVGVELDYDRIDAEVSSRDYKRFGISGSYGFQAARHLDVELDLRWRRWVYDNRYIGDDRRVDHSIQPMVRLSYEFADDWLVMGEAGWRRRWSRDPAGDESSPRGSIGVRKRFRLTD